MNNNKMDGQREAKKGFSGLQVLTIGIMIMVGTVIITLLAVRAYLFPKPFDPVVLSPVEQKQLEAKLEKLDSPFSVTRERPVAQSEKDTRQSDYLEDGSLRPEAYSEEGAKREIHFTEREINAILATNTDLADKLAIDLSDNLVSARMLVPLEPDFPFFGGKVLRVRAGVELAYRENRPVVKLRGVSLMGVPLPNAWLGGMKNIDLAREFSANESGWNAFADGIDAIRVTDGNIVVRLKE